MPFDPAQPAENSPLSSAVMRSQLNGLNTLIAAVPTITSAQVDAVSTLPAGDPATVAASVASGVLHLSFGIPEGQSGPPGEVTQAELDNAISGTLSQTSSNSNYVSLLGESADGIYNQTQMQNLINKMDELINALRR
jgi:hypothetical protein